jgi:hypothetical protein
MAIIVEEKMGSLLRGENGGNSVLTIEATQDGMASQWEDCVSWKDKWCNSRKWNDFSA